MNKNTFSFLDCMYANVTAKWLPTINGLRQLRNQCDDCGRVLANTLPHRLATPDTPEVDQAARSQCHRKCNEEREARWAAECERRQAEWAAGRAEWFDEHNEYLKSPQWWAKRIAVLKRAKGICEGCLSASAEHVHHLSYDHWRDELLWELVAVCRACHERAHGRRLDE
jgi:hypothetical protein